MYILYMKGEWNCGYEDESKVKS